MVDVSAYRVGLIVPTLNAGSLWADWLTAAANQTLTLQRKLVVDSASDDNTVSMAHEQGFEVLPIERKDFNHGTTRQLAAEYLADCDLLVFLTQDAVLASPDALANIIRPFATDADIAMSYGRQLPHKNAGSIGSHARLFNYPAVAQVKGKANIPQLGIKTTFCSDSFACYRRAELMAQGGFKHDLIFGEDAHIAARMVLADKKIAYVAEAAVYHSHDYTIEQDFKRYFDVGVFHAREAALLSQFGGATGEGLRFVKSELRYVLKNSPILLLSVMVRTLAKFVAYKMGKQEQRLPLWLKKRVSMHKRYWQT